MNNHGVNLTCLQSFSKRSWQTPFLSCDSRVPFFSSSFCFRPIPVNMSLHISSNSGGQDISAPAIYKTFWMLSDTSHSSLCHMCSHPANPDSCSASKSRKATCALSTAMFSASTNSFWAASVRIKPGQLFLQNSRNSRCFGAYERKLPCPISPSFHSPQSPCRIRIFWRVSSCVWSCHCEIPIISLFI